MFSPFRDWIKISMQGDDDVKMLSSEPQISVILFFFYGGFYSAMLFYDRKMMLCFNFS